MVELDLSYVKPKYELKYELYLKRIEKSYHSESKSTK